MSLNDYIKQDNVNVFFNLEGLGEQHTINGIPYLVIEDNNVLDKYNDMGLYQADLLIFIKEQSNLPSLTVGTAITYDKRRMMVVNVNEQIGMIEVMLQRYGS